MANRFEILQQNGDRVEESAQQHLHASSSSVYNDNNGNNKENKEAKTTNHSPSPTDGGRHGRPLLARQDSVFLEGWHVTHFLTRMSARLFGYVAFSCWAWIMFTRLCLFAFILLPAFLRIVWRYFTSPSVVRGIPYGPERRQSLDVYLPAVANNKSKQQRRPVIVSFSGGAWIIGYKAWGALMGFCYSRLGYVFVTPDYRNFPQANIDEMLADVDLAIEWCIRSVSKHGGDEDRIVLMGQSAGAHLASLALLSAIGRKNKNQYSLGEKSSQPSWSLENISGLVSISAPYNLTTLVPYLGKRGLNTVLLSALFRNDYDSYSPVSFAKRIHRENHNSNDNAETKNKKLSSFGVPIVLIHGTADVTVPYEQSLEFYQTLRDTMDGESSDLVSLIVLPDLTHTDPIIELPMKGRDVLLERTLEHLRTMVGPPDEREEVEDKKNDRATSSRDDGSSSTMVLSPMLPESVINLARFVNPF